MRFSSLFSAVLALAASASAFGTHNQHHHHRSEVSCTAVYDANSIQQKQAKKCCSQAGGVVDSLELHHGNKAFSMECSFEHKYAHNAKEKLKRCRALHHHQSCIRMLHCSYPARPSGMPYPYSPRRPSRHHPHSEDEEFETPEALDLLEERDFSDGVQVPPLLGEIDTKFIPTPVQKESPEPQRRRWIFRSGRLTQV